MHENANIFTGMIDLNGDIYQASVGRNRQKIGIDIQKESELLKQIEEMQSVIDNYYDKLVELGEIIPVKSVEQIAMEQQAEQKEINLALLDAISSLQNEIKELKSSPNDIDIEPKLVDRDNSGKFRKKGDAKDVKLDS